jgi:hypothetical protein
MCFLWNVRFGDEEKRANQFKSLMSRIVVPPESILQTSEGITIQCSPDNFLSVPASFRYFKADVAIAVYYRPWPLGIWRSHRLFRFVAHFDPAGNVVAWDRQPAVDLEKEFNSAVENLKRLGRIP